jgi:hypothetical protein
MWMRWCGGRRAFLLASFGTFLTIVLTRSLDAFNKLPADPGYSYVEEASNHGVASLAVGDPYFHIAARTLAWLTSVAPLEWHAAVLSTLVHLVWAGCAVYITYVVSFEPVPKWTAGIAGLLLICAPHASESSLGNVGNVKWPLLTAVLVLCSSSRVATLGRIGPIALVTVTGLTHPITLLCIFPLLRLGLSEKTVRRKLFPLMLVVLATTALQIAKVGVSTASSGRTVRVSEPWDGMGIFWWSGLIGPVIVAILSLAAVMFSHLHNNTSSRMATNLGVVSVVLAAVSYGMGGIADRYFVAPLTLAMVGGLLTLSDILTTSERASIAMLTAATVLMLVPTVKWFSASRYLTSGPAWSEQVQAARDLCSGSTQSRASLEIAGGSSVELECEYILRG